MIGPADGTDVDALLDASRTERNHCCWIRVGDNWIKDGENHCYCYLTPDGEKLLLLDAGLPDDERPLLLDEGVWRERIAFCCTRDARNCCCCDAGRREITAAAGCRTARNHCCGREVEKPTAAGRRTERNHICGRGGDYCCCWTQDGKKLLLLDEGWRKITAAGRGTARIHCC